MTLPPLDDFGVMDEFAEQIGVLCGDVERRIHGALHARTESALAGQNDFHLLFLRRFLDASISRCSARNS